jgi:transcriptional regulator with XRE-family HTH domain
VTWDSRGKPDLPPGPARDLVDLLGRLRRAGRPTGGQIALRTGLSASHVSEVLRGWKAPSPQAAESIARALGADAGAIAKARRLAEELAELNQHNRRKARESERAQEPATAADLAPGGKNAARPRGPGVSAALGARLLALAKVSGVGQILRTPLGRRVLATQSLVAFGLVSAMIQFLAAIFRSFPPRPQLAFVTSLGVCLAWGMARANPRFRLRHRLKNLDITVNIIVGDLFDQETHLAVGFSDTFDTSVADDRVIHSSSVQAQLLSRLYGGDQQHLDRQLAAALDGVSPVRAEPREDKPHGKLSRYPIGTVAVLGKPRRLIFGIAYGSMGNDLVVRTTVEELWHAFHQLWSAVYLHGQRGALSIPLMGSGLARVDNLDRENLLRLILLSFVAFSRQNLICHELRVVIPPGDVDRIDLVSVREFLHAL